MNITDVSTDSNEVSVSSCDSSFSFSPLIALMIYLLHCFTRDMNIIVVAAVVLESKQMCYSVCKNTMYCYCMVLANVFKVNVPYYNAAREIYAVYI